MQHPEERRPPGAKRTNQASRNKIVLLPKAHSVFSPDKRQIGAVIRREGPPAQRFASPLQSPATSEIGVGSLGKKFELRQTPNKNLDYPGASGEAP